MAPVTLAIAQGPEIFAEAEALARDHFAEVNSGIEPRRPFQLDLGQLAELQRLGVLRVYEARDVAGALVGYLTWQMMMDAESCGLPIALMGPWYVAEGHPGAAWRLFRWSLRDLARTGIRCCYPHHPVQGRGARLGKFYERLGARKCQETYSLWIGGQNA